MDTTYQKKRKPRPKEPLDLYFKTPFNLIDTPEWENLSSHAITLYLWLWHLYNKHARESGLFYHSDQQIALELKKGRRTIWGARHELMENGFIMCASNVAYNARTINEDKKPTQYLMLGAKTTPPDHIEIDDEECPF